MTTQDPWSDLEAKARLCQSRDWEVADNDGTRVQCADRGEEICTTRFASEKMHSEKRACAQFIVAAQPKAILALIAENRALAARQRTEGTREICFRCGAIVHEGELLDCCKGSAIGCPIRPPGGATP